eukprot:Nk52_evm113s485 gene=Nk52_evmTU113s485
MQKIGVLASPPSPSGNVEETSMLRLLSNNKKSKENNSTSNCPPTSSSSNLQPREQVDLETDMLSLESLARDQSSLSPSKLRGEEKQRVKAGGKESLLVKNATSSSASPTTSPAIVAAQTPHGSEIVAEIPLASSYLLKQLSLEEENRHLRESLMHLTSHVGQIQFRVKQLCDNAGKNRLSWQQVRDLEKFVFSSCLDEQKKNEQRVKEKNSKEVLEEVKKIMTPKSTKDKIKKDKRVKSEILKQLPGRRMSLDLPRDKEACLDPLQEQLLVYLQTQIHLVESFEMPKKERKHKKGTAPVSKDMKAFLTSQLELNAKELIVLEELKIKTGTVVQEENSLSKEQMKQYVEDRLVNGKMYVTDKNSLVKQIRSQICELQNTLYYIQDGSFRELNGTDNVHIHRDSLDRISEDKGSVSGSSRRNSFYESLDNMFTITRGEGSDHSRSSSISGGNRKENLQKALADTASTAKDIARSWGISKVSSIKESFLSNTKPKPGLTPSHEKEECMNIIKQMRGSEEKLTALFEREKTVKIRNCSENLSPHIEVVVKGYIVKPLSLLLHHGFKCNRIFSAQLHLWDAFCKYYDTHPLCEFLEVNCKRLNDEDVRKKFEDSKLTPDGSLFHAVGRMEIIGKVHKFDKDDKFRHLIYKGLNEKMLHIWLGVLSSSSVVSELYEASAFIANPDFHVLTTLLEDVEKFSFKLPST